MPAARPRLKLPIGDRADRRSASSSATPEEAAAVVAALERFLRATAPARRAPQRRSDAWLRAAILEGVERDSEADVSDPWINT